MKVYLLRRLLQSLLVLFGVSCVVFFILYLTGDPALVLLPPDASAEDVIRFREVMGFNDPFIVQYGRFLAGALRGNFGQSIRHGEPAFDLVIERMPATFELAGAGLLIALCLAIPAGIISAVRRNTLGRLRGHRGRASWPVDADLLAGHHAHPGFLGSVQPAAVFRAGGACSI